MQAIRALWVNVFFAGAAACSSGERQGGLPEFGAGGATFVAPPATGRGGAQGAAAGTPGLTIGGSNAIAPLSAHIEHDHVVVTFVTLSCAGGCADVEAVAMGGDPPYSFTWEDGTRSAARHVCPTSTTAYEVAVTDTGATSGEFTRDPDTVRAALTAQVLSCPLDGGTAPPPPPPPPPNQDGLCVSNPSFEGTAAITEFGGFNAPPWTICDPPGSPDIRNASVGWTVPGPEPTDGATYLEVLWLAQPWRETLAEPLCAPMVAGRQYSFRIDLSYQGWVEGVAPGRLEIWGSNASCGEDQLLFTSPTVEADWHTYCATFTAEQAFTYLQLKPADQQTGVLVDNIVPVASCAP